VQGIIRESRVSRRPPEVWPVIAFDVNEEKVGKPLRDAIQAPPNCTSWLGEDLSSIAAFVFLGPLLDGLSPPLRRIISVSEDQIPADIPSLLKEVRAEVLVIALPTGAQAAAEAYARAALEGGVAIINGMPANIAKLPEINQLASTRGLAIIGDDIKSQIGATIVHRALMDVFRTRGGCVEETLQLDWGGDADFMNLVCGGRYDAGKRAAKTKAVVWNHPKTRAHISASDYVPFLGNLKEAYMRLEGTLFAGAKVRLNLFMSVEDAYNSAGILVQAIKCAGLATRCGFGGVLDSPSAWFCKHPPKQMTDHEAHDAYIAFMESLGDAGKIN
jgi:myo-inositol-1-phosphate synthase